MRKHFVGFITITLALCFFIGSVPSVNAQDEFTLEEVIVTAEKRAETLQDVSLPITSYTGDDLIEKAAVGITDVLNYVPNVQIMPTGGGQGYQLIFRGVGSSLPPGMGEPAVAYNVDGAANIRSEAGIFGYFDLDRIEVIRGPQGTLYGRNATGGVINVLTANPNTEQIEGYMVFEAGTYSLLREEGAINIPLGDKFATRFAFSNINRKGFMSNGGGDQVGTAIRGKFGYYPNDDVSVMLAYSNTKLGGIGSNTAVYPEDWAAGKYYTCNETEPYSKFDRRNFKWNLDVTINNVGPGVIQFIPSYYMFRSQGWGPNRMTGEMTQASGDQEQEQAELRYSSLADAKVQWVTGLYYYNRSEESEGTPTRPLPSSSYAKSEAVFGQITYPFTDAFRLIAGGRWSDEKKNADNPNIDVYDVTGSFGGFDWKVGLEADLAEDVMSFFTVSTARRPGGINTHYVPASGAMVFKEETLMTGELGLKSRFADNRVQVNGNIFWASYDDYQIVDGWIDELGDIVEVFYNADKVKSYGAEIEANAFIGTATLFNLTISWLHNRYASPCTLHESFFAPPTELEGKQLSNAPDYSVKGGIEHSFSLSGGGMLKPSISFRWSDDIYVGTFPSISSLQPRYTIYDGHLQYTSASGKWSLNFWVKNAMDKVYKTGYNHGNVMVAEPRMSGATINIKF